MLDIKTRIKFNYFGDIKTGMIYNVSEWREPALRYAVDGDDRNDDFYFIGEDDIIEVLNDNE